MYTDVTEIVRDAEAYREQLSRAKRELQPSTFWYPYDSLANFIHLDRLLTGANRGAFNDFRNLTIADIGAADGDTSFFFESLGNAVDIVDYGPTNFNGLRGAAELKRHFNSAVTINDVDLDAQFTLPRERYDVAIFLGILYHLKNPFFVLEALARRTERCFLSTKVAKFAKPGGLHIEPAPVAYLLNPDEANNDATNYWVFTNAGLLRLLDRTGWDVLDFMTVGNTTASDPGTAAGDERAFCYLRSRMRPG
jgi:tRNA (mo5U34)-methyltransferase